MPIPVGASVVEARPRHPTFVALSPPRRWAGNDGTDRQGHFVGRPHLSGVPGTGLQQTAGVAPEDVPSVRADAHDVYTLAEPLPHDTNRLR
jgi:hypothetical protein